MDLNALIATAHQSPELALATLWRALANSIPDRQAAAEFSCPGNEQGEHYVVSMVHAALRGNGRCQPLTYPAHAFPTLRALDEHLYQLAAGEAPLQPEPVEVGGLAHWVLRRPAQRTPHLARQSDQIAHYLRHHFVVPARVGNLRVDADLLPLSTFQVFTDRGTEKIRVVAGGFEDGVEPVNLLGAGRKFRTQTLTDVPTRHASALALLKASADAHLLVMPELTIPPGVLTALADHLEQTSTGPLLTVAGSYHVQIAPGRWVNEATILDHNGNVLGKHHKIARINVPEAYEDIATGDRILLLAGPIGVMAVAICRDFCEVELTSFWDALSPDWVLVPSMGNRATQTAHQRQAERLDLRASTVTVVANQPHASHRDTGVTPGGAVWRHHGQCLLAQNELRDVHMWRVDVLWNRTERS